MSERVRPSWDQYFLGLAFAASTRSHDVHTQHGCVIVTERQHVLACGYNGFPRHLPDAELPTERPGKYDWMMHAERNALANAPTRPFNCTAYVTGECCLPCLMALWQHGVICVVQAQRHGSHAITEDERSRREWFLTQSDMVVVTRPFDPAWLAEALEASR